MDTHVLTSLATLVGAKLREKGLMIVTAESCTGGWIGQALTAIAGSSDYYERGFITYSNDAKRELLGVPESTLQRFGAVSEETARAMAAGALAHSRAQVALSVTGVAGPAGGNERNPVGTVCFAWAFGGGSAGGVSVAAERRHFDGDRDAVRRQSVVHALQGVLERLDNGPA